MTKHSQESGLSRRQWGRIASVLGGGAAALPFFNEFSLAQEAAPRRAGGGGMRGAMAKDMVRISSNENPLGPCAEACEAIAKIAKDGGRYSPHGEQQDFVAAVAEAEGLKAENISPYAGSSDPLHRAVCAFTSPSRSYVMGDPGYEAGARTAEFIGSKVYRVPLRADFSHDVEAMLAKDSKAGVIYICNPNNPTGTLTSRKDIDFVLANKPAGSILLLDEAYVHFAGDESGSDLVKAGKDVIVLRTFSKAYGMAGIRAGMAMGRADLLEKLRPFGSGMLPITGLVAASTSVRVKGLVAERRKINKAIRDNVFEFLDAKNFKYVPSVSNKFMLEVNRPGMEIVQALAKEKIMIGRVWPAWPTKVRVTVGTQEEMDKFKVALVKVMA